MTFIYFDILASLFPIIFFFIHWNKSKPTIGLWLIAVYSFLWFATNSLILVWSKIPLLYDSFTLMEYLLFSGFLHSQLKSKVSKRLLRLCCLIFTIFYIAFLIYTKTAADTASIPENAVVLDSIPIGVEAILVLMFSFYYLYEQTKDTTTLFIYQTFQFWVILGIVLYLAGSFFVYIFSNYVPSAQLRKFWTITNIFSIVRSFLFCIAIILHSKPTKNNILITDLELTYLN